MLEGIIQQLSAQAVSLELQNNPAVQGLLQRAVFLRDAQATAALYQLLSAFAAVASRVPFWRPPYTYDQALGQDVTLGRILGSDSNFSLSRAQLLNGAFISGSTGTGKTSLLTRMILQERQDPRNTLLIFDLKDDYAGLGLLDRTLVLKLENLKINLFEPWLGVTPEEHQSNLLFLLGQSFWLNSPSLSKITEALQHCQSKGTPASLQTVIASLQQRLNTTRAGPEKDYLFRAVDRLKDLQAESRNVLECSAGHPLAQLFNTPSLTIVIDVSGFREDIKAFYTSYLLSSLYLHRKANQQRVTTTEHYINIYIDECSSLYPENLEGREGAVPRLQELANKYREFGISQRYATQEPSKVLTTIMNLGIFISFSVRPEEDRRAVTNALGNKSFPSLPPGTAIASIETWSKPFIFYTPPIKIAKGVSHDLVKQRMQDIVSRLPWTPHDHSVAEELPSHPDIQSSNSPETAREVSSTSNTTTPATDDGKALDNLEDAFLRDAANPKFFWSFLKERFERLNIPSASVQQKVLKSLIARNLIRIWKVVVGRGSRASIAEVLDQGWKHLKLERPSQQGDHSHAGRYYLHQLHSRLDKLGWQPQIEASLSNGRRADLLAQTPSGVQVAVELAMTASHESHNALKTLEAGVTIHVVVAEDLKTLDSVKKGLEKHSLFTSRIRLCTVTEFLSNPDGIVNSDATQ